MKNIKKDEMLLDKTFPFRVTNAILPPGYNMNKTYHWHDCLEISFVKTGRGRYYIEDKSFEMNAGDIIIINNVEPHYIEVFEEEMQQPVIIFDPVFIWSNTGSSIDYDYLKPFFERGTDFSNKLDLSNPLTKEIRSHLEELVREYIEKPEGYQLMIKARLMVILAYLLRHFRDTKKLEENTPSKRQCLLRLEEVYKYINENFKNDIMLNDLAEKIHVSPQYFSAFFKKVTGVTFSVYLNNIRINNALRLLRETGKKITHIAMECGFNNTTNFNNMFKKTTGKTPSEVRKSS